MIQPKDLEWIEKIAKDDALRGKVIESMAPTVLGFETLKEAIALQLFGSPPIELPSGKTIRGNLHILICHDPDERVARLLKQASSIALGGTYLFMPADDHEVTPKIVREDLAGKNILKGGELIKARGGLACIDDFDRVNKTYDTIQEVMKRQTISIAKKGIDVAIKADISVLAASSPKHGKFDKFEPLPKQIDTPLDVLANFDLVFIFLNMHDEKSRNLAKETMDLISEVEEYQHYLSREDLRKLVLYARKHLNPKFKSQKARQVIEDFVIKHFKEESLGYRVPSRSIMGLIETFVRIAKANARLRLSDEVTGEDSEKAVELFKASLVSLGYLGTNESQVSFGI